MGESNKIFVDSNYFIALYNPLDSLHPKAIEINQKITEKETLFITDYIFLEVVTVLSQKVNKKTAVRIGKHLRDDEVVNFVPIDLSFVDLTWQIFQKVKNKNMSFVDCSILVVMRSWRINTLLSFDSKDFGSWQKQYNFKLFPDG